MSGVVEHVLLADHVKELKAMPNGVWPQEFDEPQQPANAASGSSGNGATEEVKLADELAAKLDVSTDATRLEGTKTDNEGNITNNDDYDDEEDDDDGLPPHEENPNHRVGR